MSSSVKLASRRYAVLAVACAWLGAFSANTVTIALANAAEMVQAQAGIPFVIRLQANPSTGYRWRLDRNASTGLDKVRIRDLGTATAQTDGNRGMIGTPATHRWRSEPVASAQLRLEMIYSHPWENKPPTRRKTYNIEIREK